MTDIVFSFDVEDLANLEGMDGVLRTAEILRKHGIRGCFQMVGMMAEIFEREGRTDIIEALQYHEIDDHSYQHSVHPTINEMTDLEDYGEARTALMAIQQKNHGVIRRIFGVDKIHSVCPPGFSVSYVSHYVSAELGVPVFCGGILYDCVHMRPVHYCNMLCTGYNIPLEDTLLVRDDNNVATGVRNQKDLLAIYDKVAEEQVLEVSFHHPTMAMCTEFWDVVNCVGKNPSDGIMKPSKHNPPEWVEGYYERFDWLVGMIKADPRFRIVTYEDIAREYAEGDRVITREDIPWIKARLEEKFFPVTTPRSLCMSDIFHACRAFLQGENTHACGFVYGFLEEPYAITAPVTVTKAAMEASAKTLAADGWLPLAIPVGEIILGPGDWIRAALAVLAGEEAITLQPADWQIDLNQFPPLRDCCFNPGYWPIETPESLEDKVLTKRAKLQSWTIRLPQNTPRLVFAE